MRVFALAAIIGLGLCVGAADARVYTDPAGRIVFDTPTNWPVGPLSAPEGVSYIIAGNDDNECHFIVRTRAETASATAYNVWRTLNDDARFTDAFWLGQANSVARLFPGNSAVLVSHSRDDSAFWPMQRAEFTAPSSGRHIYAGFAMRPGVEMLGLCLSYEGTPPMATFDSALRSMAHPNDATFRASAEEQIAARAAAQAPQPAPAPAPNR
ncbi:MAG: hypothetical protein ABL883_14940 [Terricaulis sp.]